MRLRKVRPNVYAKMLQAGGGVGPVFKGKIYTRRMHGAGLGKFFGKMSMPLLKKIGSPMIKKIGTRLMNNLPTIGKSVAKSVAPEIMASAVDVGKTILSGKANKKSIINALKKNKKTIMNKTLQIIKQNAFKGGGKRMKGGNLMTMRKTRGRKIKKNDIFSSL